MPTPEKPRGRGRPRAYDPHVALLRSLNTFWAAGYSATSLDDLVAATGMKRPSLYAAFGDKQAIYLKVLEDYWRMSAEAMQRTLPPDRPLAEGLMRVYETALTIYYPPAGPQLGCFAIGTALTEAATDPKIRATLDAGLRMLDKAFEKRFELAIKAGELPSDAHAETLAFLASATLHTIAIRARAGATRAHLKRHARKAVDVMCS